MRKISAYIVYFIVISAVIAVFTLLAIDLLDDGNKAPVETDVIIDWGQRAKDIASVDEGLRSIIGNRSYTVPGGIIWNESFVQLYYSIDSKIYDIAVNLTGKKVVYVKEETDAAVIDWLSKMKVTATTWNDNRGKIKFTHDTVLTDSLKSEIINITLENSSVKEIIANKNYKIGSVQIGDFERNFPDGFKGTYPAVEIFLGKMTPLDETYTVIIDYNERNVIGIMHSYPDPWPL